MAATRGHTEPCRDKLPSTLGLATGSDMVSATVKTLHKVLPHTKLGILAQNFSIKKPENLEKIHITNTLQNLLYLDFNNTRS